MTGNKPMLGVLEGFYGRPWSESSRLRMAHWLPAIGIDAYLYAPKADAYLRKQWQRPWPRSHRAHLAAVAQRCTENQLSFHVGLSPFELYRDYDRAARSALKAKVGEIIDVGASGVAILFDDMPGDLDSLPLRQAEICADVCHWVSDREVALRVCPSYYSDDPVLDEIFGQRPPGYLKSLHEQLDGAYEVFWTGPAVCSDTISASDLAAAHADCSGQLAIWDNYPVNDSRARSPHIYVDALSGRSEDIGGLIKSHWCNAMNQPALSLPALASLSNLYSQLPAHFNEVLGEAGLSRRLARQGVLEHERLLNVMGRLLGADSRIRQGEYRVRQGTTPEALLTLLQSGKTIRYRVTLPEGITLADALMLIQASEGVSSILSGPDDDRLQDLVAPATSTEGYFLPETYQYERGDSDFELLSQAYRMMEETLAEVWQGRRAQLPYSEPYEALILASIIEKETGLASERGTIGGVFVRRLEQGMRLQTDPTVIYGLGDAFHGNLQRKHLNDQSNAYNSYRHHGLPPGPIALPGKAALMAAVSPEAGDSLYFVARGDGSHEFSATLKEHEDAVRRFQLSRRANYRSAPESK